MKQIEGGVTAAKGFQAAGVEVGIKAGHAGKKDMAMIYSETCCKTAGTFTSNIVNIVNSGDFQITFFRMAFYIHLISNQSSVQRECFIGKYQILLAETGYLTVFFC